MERDGGLVAPEGKNCHRVTEGTEKQSKEIEERTSTTGLRADDIWARAGGGPWVGCVGRRKSGVPGAARE
ncbi:MAG: hypothetical protein NVS9B14_14140 [Candidatus Acidiferrum sp.]